MKIGAAPPIGPAMRQAIRDTDGRPPMVVTKQDRGEWLVTMRAVDVLPLIAATLREYEVPGERLGLVADKEEAA